MSSSPQEPDFESLRRLLSLKRYEQPPPGYFVHFSDRVIARLEAEGAARQRGWWRFLVPDLDARPVLAGAYGVLVGGLLVGGVWFSAEEEPQPTGGFGLATQWPSFAPQRVSMPVEPKREWVEPAAMESSIAPVMSSAPPSHLFNPNGVRVEQASFGFRPAP